MQCAVALLDRGTEQGVFAEMKRRMAQPVIFDGRNLYDPQQMQEAGFTYYSIGRVPVGA